MARVDNNAEGGTNGTTVTTGNSGGASGTAFSAVSIASGTTCTFSNVSPAPLHGTMSYLYTVSTGANAVTTDLPVSANANGSVSILVRWTGLPSGEIQGPITLRGGGSTYARIQTASAGTVRCTLDSNGSLSSGAMATGTTYRIDLVWYNFGTANSILVCNIYNYETGALVLTCSHRGTTAGTVDTVRLGKNGGTATITGLIIDRIYTDAGKLNELGFFPDAYLNTWGEDPIDTRVEIYSGINTDASPRWRDIVRHSDNLQAGVYGSGRSDIRIERGRKDETRAIDASSCTFQLNNRDGRYSPRNPSSPYFGYIGRNTPVRVSVPAYESYMQLGGGATAAASTPDSSALSITGDIDIRANMDLDNWWGQRRGVLDKYLTTGNQRSYQVLIEEDGYPRLQWSTNGTNNINVVSTIPLPFTSGRWSIRWTNDVNNGSGGYTVTFYYSADTDLTNATWTTLDTVTTTAGTTSIFDSTASVFIGDNQASDVSSEGLYDKFYSAQIRNGIAGTIVANPDFTNLTGNTAAFHDTASTPNIWTLQNTAYIEDRDYRFYGEISEWPVKWDVTGNDVWVEVEAAGPFRRLGQASQSAQSAMRRTISVHPDMVAYWPIEDGEGATVPTTGAKNGTNMRDSLTLTSDFAEYTGTFKGTSTLANINLNTWYGGVPRYTSTGNIEVQWLMYAPAGQIPNDTIVLRLFTTGTAGRWDVVYTTAGSGALEVKAYDFEGVSILSGGATALGGGIDGKDNFYTLQLVQNGSNIDWELRSYQIDSEESWLDSGTLNSYTVGAATGVHANSEGTAGAAAVAYGQIAVFKEIVTDLDSDQAVMADAYRRESAANRILRLLDEEAVIFRERGARGSSSAMGWQGASTLISLLQEAAETDGGWLFEDRERLGVVYRTRASNYAVLPSCTLDYEQSEMLQLEATENDEAIANDVTVTRDGGGSYRATLDSGAMSTEEPPTGVGRYPQDYTLSMARDSSTQNQAGWRLSKGTVNEPRYNLRLELAQNEFFSSESLRAQIRGLEIGNRLDIANPPSWLPPSDLRLIVQGYTEAISNFTHTFDISTQPFAPWETGFYDPTDAFFPEEGARYSPPEGTVTNEALDTTETGVDVTNPVTGYYFSSSAVPYDIVIGGEQMTVTSVSGTGASQTLTVTRSVNGVVKSHLTGAAIELFIPARYGL